MSKICHQAVVHLTVNTKWSSKVQLSKPDKKPTLLSVSPGLRGLTKRSSRFRSPPLRSQTCTEYTVKGIFTLNSTANSYAQNFGMKLWIQLGYDELCWICLILYTDIFSPGHLQFVFFPFTTRRAPTAQKLCDLKIRIICLMFHTWAPLGHHLGTTWVT